jgi:hypothetical protein
MYFIFFFNVSTNVAEPEPQIAAHHFCGAGTATRCGSGSGSDGTSSKPAVQHGLIIKNVTNCISFLLFLLNLIRIRRLNCSYPYFNLCLFSKSWFGIFDGRSRSRIKMIQLRNIGFNFLMFLG